MSGVMSEVVERWYLDPGGVEVFETSTWLDGEDTEMCWRIEVCRFEQFDTVVEWDVFDQDYVDVVDEDSVIIEYLCFVYRKEYGRKIIKYDNPAIGTFDEPFCEWRDVGDPLGYFGTKYQARAAGIERMRELASREITVKVR